MNKHEMIRVGITIGDYNGIGVEVVLKALSDLKILDHCLPVVYGSPRVLSFYKKITGLNELNFNFIKTAEQLQAKKLNLVVCWEEETDIKPGEASADAGKYALLAFDRAIQDARDGKIDVIVTAPLDKSTVNTPQTPFKGHTEHIGNAYNVADPLMMLVCNDLKIALVTGHVPLKEVASRLTQERITQKIRKLNDSLKHDFGIPRPRIAVLGLNPHAGDNGLLGKEEEEIIAPAIAEVYREGITVFGPYPADGFFGAAQFRQFDAVLAMYHDQGLIPFKYLGFEDGVNFTAGLPVIRTSPDHGTAYAIAGKNVAIEESMRNAIYMACELYKRRNELAENGKNPLKFMPMKRERFRMEF